MVAGVGAGVSAGGQASKLKSNRLLEVNGVQCRNTPAISESNRTLKNKMVRNDARITFNYASLPSPLQVKELRLETLSETSQDTWTAVVQKQERRLAASKTISRCLSTRGTSKVSN